MVRVRQTQRQPVPDHPPGNLGGRAMPWSAEEILDGQRQGVDLPTLARTAHNGPFLLTQVTAGHEIESEVG